MEISLIWEQCVAENMLFTSCSRRTMQPLFSVTASKCIITILYGYVHTEVQKLMSCTQWNSQFWDVRPFSLKHWTPLFMPLFKPTYCLFSKSLLSAKNAWKSLCIQENSSFPGRGGDAPGFCLAVSCLKTHLLKTA